MQPPDPGQLEIRTLGPCPHPSPLAGPFIEETDRVLVPRDTTEFAHCAGAGTPPSFEAAGPRTQLFFDPSRLGCGIVTCGGLCPGLNNVVRAIVLRLWYAYGVRRIYGFRYGYAGLNPASGHVPMVLRPGDVDTIHEHGGTLLGSSRGPQDLATMVDTLVRLDVGLLFVCGGDGGLRGAAAVAGEVTRRGLPIAVVGVPKTIDNDLLWTARSFGFATAVEEAARVLTGAHAEARGAWNGISIVKLMGRHSGFIAAQATLANADVNFCLVPEVPFTLEGRGGFLDTLEARIDEKHHAVIAVAEGAAQDVLQDPAHQKRDASGNLRLEDVGLFLRERITAHFVERRKAVTIRYIDPSYVIRSLPANAYDAQFCFVLGQHAVHAGMAGRTAMFVGFWNQRFTHVPIALATAGRKRLDPHDEIWLRTVEATGQPASMVAR